jgi:hypothetical protein
MVSLVGPQRIQKMVHAFGVENLVRKVKVSVGRKGKEAL